LRNHRSPRCRDLVDVKEIREARWLPRGALTSLRRPENCEGGGCSRTQIAVSVQTLRK
jgi:hypothetical protein